MRQPLLQRFLAWYTFQLKNEFWRSYLHTGATVGLLSGLACGVRL